MITINVLIDCTEAELEKGEITIMLDHHIHWNAVVWQQKEEYLISNIKYVVYMI